MIVTLKLAMSLDGAIALSSGESQWITGLEARAEGHRLRAGHDAILVGIGTALADDPELTARIEPPPARQPVRVVLDRHLRLSPASKLAATIAKGKVIALSTDITAGRPAVLEAAGIALEQVQPTEGEGEIAAALRVLRERHGIASILVEGGAGVAAAFLRENLVDRLELFRAPMLIGGDGLRALGPLGLATLDGAPRFEWVASQRLGPDLWDSYRRI